MRRAAAFCTAAIVAFGAGACHRAPGHPCIEYGGGATPDDPGSCPRCPGEAPRSLSEAARCHDAAALRRFIERAHADPNLRRPVFGYTALHDAITSYAVYWHPPSAALYAAVRYLLEHGADPNLHFPDRAHATPLHYAAYDGNMALVPLLVEHGADVNARDDDGRTPLHWAAACDFRLSCDDCSSGAEKRPLDRWKEGAAPTIRYLARHGAELRARDHQGRAVRDLIPDACKETALVVDLLLGARR